MKSTEKFVLVLVASLGLLLAGCGGGSSTTTAPVDPDPGPTPQELAMQQHTEVSNAVTAAQMAVGALTAMSTDAEVTAAEGLIAAARTALGEADLLSANQVFVLSSALTTVEGNLATTKTDIADHRQMLADQQQMMMEQRTAANNAIDAANVAVAGLSATSTDAEVQAAKDLIQAAKDAVTAATALSMGDRDGLNSRISNIETMLSGTESNITDHRLATGASDAVDAAHDAVAGLSATSTDAEVQAAKDAIQAAKDALDAANARSAVTAAEATAHSRRISMIESTLATTEMAIAAHREQVEEDDETQRMADVADARSRAMTSYMEADADAMKAEAAADAAEEAAPGSQGAMDARTAATAARTAANAAKAAHDAIMDDMSKADADAQAQMAADEAGKANSSYMAAKIENDRIQTNVATNEEQQRQRDVAAATMAASEAATAARTSATAARESATAARMAANAARMAYEHAVRARTDSENARMEYMEADTAATAAENAATAAEMAADDAEAAHMGIDAAGTAADAQAAQMTAETERDDAADEAMTASTQQTTAETAQSDAMMASVKHVIGLLIAANGQDITEPVGDDTSTPAVNESMSVEQLQAAAAARSADAVDTAAGETDNGSGGTTAMATWPGVPDDPDTPDTDESAMSVFMLQVAPEGGTALTFRTAAIEDNPDTVDTDESMPQTVGNIDPLGDFRGYEINDGTTHAIVFTDKTQDDAPVAAVTDAPARSVVGEPITTASELSGVTSSGTTITGVTWTPASEAPLMGTLTCGGTCNIVLGEDGAVTTIEGYTFTGSRPAREAVTAMDAAAQAAANNDYLVFGVWMQDVEVLDAEGTVTTPNDFGAFQDGGREGPVAPEITGTATYEGSATGLYTAGESVDYFQGDATLEADFGANDAQGTITGRVDNIVAGGNNMNDVIHLNDDGTPADGNITTAGAITGDARMGTATTVDNVTTYSHNGSWSGQFYNGTADDQTTADVNESHVAPGSVAGTFGVTGMTGTGDDAITRSYVGAFGAHKED